MKFYKINKFVDGNLTITTLAMQIYADSDYVAYGKVLVKTITGFQDDGNGKMFVNTEILDNSEIQAGKNVDEEGLWEGCSLDDPDAEVFHIFTENTNSHLNAIDMTLEKGLKDLNETSDEIRHNLNKNLCNFSGDLDAIASNVRL